MPLSVLKPELVEILYQRLSKHYKQDIHTAVDIILNSIITALQQGKRIEVRGFGSFYVIDQAGRTFQNPKTKKISHYPPCKRIHFQPSPLLSNHKQTARHESGSFEAQEKNENKE
jgi:integration host factor subunit beta